MAENAKFAQEERLEERIQGKGKAGEGGDKK